MSFEKLRQNFSIWMLLTQSFVKAVFPSFTLLLVFLLLMLSVIYMLIRQSWFGGTLIFCFSTNSWLCQSVARGYLSNNKLDIKTFTNFVFCVAFCIPNILLSFDYTYYFFFVLKGINFQLTAVLISIGTYAYIEHGELWVGKFHSWCFN